MSQGSLLQKVLTERTRQDRQWGGPEHDDRHHGKDWKGYILEHADRSVTATTSSLAEAQHELVKVAALGFAMAEVVDRARERIAALERDCAQLETAHLCPDCEKQVVWDNEQCPNCGACGH